MEDLEWRMRVRMTEARVAARAARIRMYADDPEAAELLGLERTVQHHEALAEALRDVLGGDF